jgi:hypothetical protein
VGDKIEVLYRHKHAQFRVDWMSAAEGSSEKQIGAECLEPGKHVWVTEFPEQEMSTKRKIERSSLSRQTTWSAEPPNLGSAALNLTN